MPNWRPIAAATVKTLAAAKSDLAGLSGLVILSTGLWWIYPPLTLLTIGGALLAAGVRWGIQDARKKPQ